MGDHQLFHAHFPGGLDHREDFVNGDMAGAQHHIVLLNQLQDLSQLRDDLTVLYYVHAVIGGLAQLLQMVPGGRGGQPHHLCSQLQGIFHGHGVNAAYAPVEHNGAEHGEIVIAVHSLVVSVCQIGPVDGAAQVGLDDNGPGSHSNRCVAELKIVVSPCPQVRICVDVHINHALHGNFSHDVSSFVSDFFRKPEVLLAF